MCIIFVWRRSVNDVTSRYKFILASNRDEYLYRPALPADFWKDHPHVLAGRDMTDGVQGGTWLGITRHGSIAFLTNIRKRPEEMLDFPNRRGRGALLSNFLVQQHHQQQTAYEYINHVASEKTEYRPFNLIIGNVLGDLYYINSDDDQQPEKIESEYTCLTNCLLHGGWLKMENSLRKFKDVMTDIKTNDTTASIDEAQQKLLMLLVDRERNFPDPLLDDNERNDYRSSIFLPTDNTQYGTRTNTVITVDRDNHVTYFERTKERLEDDDVSTWRKSTYEFTIEESSPPVKAKI